MPSASERRCADAPQESSSRILSLLAPHIRAGFFSYPSDHQRNLRLVRVQLDYQHSRLCGLAAESVHGCLAEVVPVRQVHLAAISMSHILIINSLFASVELCT